MQTATAALPSPHVICAKFRVEGCTPSVPESNLSSSQTAPVEHWTDPWSGETIQRENEGFLWGRRESKEDMKQQRKNTAEGSDRSRGGSIPREDQHESRAQGAKNESLLSFLYDININDGAQGIWLVLDTLDEFGMYRTPLMGRGLTVLYFLSALKPLASITPMFTRQCQLFFGAQLPISGLSLFLSFFHVFTPFFPHQRSTSTTLPLPRMANGGFSARPEIGHGRPKRSHELEVVGPSRGPFLPKVP